MTNAYDDLETLSVTADVPADLLPTLTIEDYVEATFAQEFADRPAQNLGAGLHLVYDEPDQTLYLRSPLATYASLPVACLPATVAILAAEALAKYKTPEAIAYLEKYAKK